MAWNWSSYVCPKRTWHETARFMFVLNERGMKLLELCLSQTNVVWNCSSYSKIKYCNYKIPTQSHQGIRQVEQSKSSHLHLYLYNTTMNRTGYICTKHTHKYIYKYIYIYCPQQQLLSRWSFHCLDCSQLYIIEIVNTYISEAIKKHSERHFKHGLCRCQCNMSHLLIDHF